MISIIAIIDKNRAIGKNNDLLWNIPSDLKNFKKITKGHTVIMGRKTYESIGSVLPDRKNIILSSNKKYKIRGAIIYNSIQKLLKKYYKSKEEVFVIGGGTLYEQFLPFADKLYLSIVQNYPKDADTFFPKYLEFNKRINKKILQKKNPKCIFLILTRSSKNEKNK